MSGYEIPSVEPGLDTIWVAINTFLIMFMQLGFSFVEAGSVRKKNVHSILMKNTLDICIGTVTWWLFGYAFAFGESRASGFIGSSKDLYVANQIQSGSGYVHWLNQWAFASTATTIISGAVAERLLIQGYQVICLVMTGFIYPVVVHWAWGNGWLMDQNFHDFAGTNAVHMVGGVAGLVATIIIGPRIGRFDKNRQRDFRPHSIKDIVLGTIVLWFCWYGFNCGTVQGFSDDIESASTQVGLVGINTTLGAIGGALVAFFVGVIINKHVDYNVGTVNICMGILAGLVAITGCCNVVEPWAALLTGMVGSLVYIGHSKLLVKLKIDDPLDASSIHFACGVWGGIATGLFQFENGLIYGGDRIGIQVLGILCICAWTGGLTAIIALLMKKIGWLRCSAETEEIGFDYIHDPESIQMIEVEKQQYLQQQELYQQQQKQQQQQTQQKQKQESKDTIQISKYSNSNSGNSGDKDTEAVVQNKSQVQ